MIVPSVLLKTGLLEKIDNCEFCMTKICCFFNYPPHYRYPIYKAMAEEFDCDFYFGDSVFEPLKQFDVKLLKGFKSYFHAVRTKFKGYVWYKGCLQLFRMKYDIYILTGENLIIPNWLVLLWAKITRKKVVLWTHGIHQCFTKKSTLKVLKYFYCHVDYLLMYNNYNWQYMEKLGCDKSRLYTIHNSLDTPLQTKIYKNLKTSDVYLRHFGNMDPVVIYIGRIQKRKKIEQIVEAMLLAKKQGFKFNLILVGEVQDDFSIKKMVENYGLSQRTWFYGPSFDEKLNAQLLYDASVCVCPAAVGLSAIHALSYGCPVVSNDNVETQMPEFESIVDGKTGALFKENDISDLLEKIKYWCSLTQEERTKTRAIARKYVLKEWSVDYQIKVLKKILK